MESRHQSSLQVAEATIERIIVAGGVDVGSKGMIITLGIGVMGYVLGHLSSKALRDSTGRIEVGCKTTVQQSFKFYIMRLCIH